ncbi:MAG: DUF1877 family protein [Eubacteriales bacterium]|nr:DUF1877 family protein [Eubacteriales bacterium]
MKVRAYYFEADEKLVESLKKSSDMDRIDQLEMIQDLHKVKYYSMGEWWDALHFVLTGVSASMPIEYSALSEAVVGKRLFDEDENAAFIAYTLPEEVEKIFAALDWLKVKEVMSTFSLADLQQQHIYPEQWEVDKEDTYKQEIATAFKTLRKFYEVMVQNKKGVVIGIY